MFYMLSTKLHAILFLSFFQTFEDIMKIHILFLSFPLIFDFTSPSTHIMVLLHGELTNFLNFTEKTVNWSSCVTNCHNKLDCIVAGFENGTCKLFEIGKLSTIKRLNSHYGKMVAVKTVTNLTSCDYSTNGNVLQGFINHDQPYNVTISQNTWIIQKPPKCPENFEMFHRLKGLWCIGVINKTLTSQEESSDFCKSEYNGVLNAFDNETERDFVFRRTNGSVSPLNEHGDAYWVNGVRKESCRNNDKIGSDCDGIKAFNITDPLITEVYNNWVEDQVIGTLDNCLVYRVAATQGKSTVAVPCDWVVAYAYRLKGFVCGTRPV
ncbi:CW domain-containing protein [Caenorhabditis elegans]|uniref:CW domain-containing protein n=1 Tax=Caenorhabditis elegans TaxID=6239 RepID=O01337_CAEEL|nr:CW domain-containing protein [Caenorhabditis elegans]CAB04564.3 CW domain-containing protein [Caenorhabditis elegans]